ncbi:MAG: hypothetical protein GXO85_03665 [Chlorobi bacterium]|nr:hypothetical protein [Chlorobiota bacterium]
MFGKIGFVILFLSLILFLTNCEKHVVKSIKLSKGPHLFIDDYLIAENSFLNRTVNNPKKLSEPILRGGKKYDDIWQPYVSVLKDPKTGIFRMWYNVPVNENEMSRCRIGYIESYDGIHWIRPHKVLDFPSEIQFGVTVLDRGIDFEDPSERFVLATYLKPGLRIATSPDGFKWTLISDKPVLLHNHDITSVFWDTIRKQYFAIVSHRLSGFGDPSNPSIDDRRRIPHESISKDLKHWKKIWPIIEPKISAPIEEGETQFYAMSGVLTRGDILIGLVKVLRDDLNATYGKTGKEMGDMKRKAAGIGYTVLAWSRDGITWQRDHEPFIPRNPVPGTFDHAMAWGDEQIIVGDETYIYYAGYERGHKINRFNERHLGFARMPRDRYVSMEADFNGGTLITKPLILNGKKITINANVVGECKVRLLDNNYEPISGFGWINLIGDSVSHKVNWQEDLYSLSDKSVRLEFKLKNAQLFGFDLY